MRKTIFILFLFISFAVKAEYDSTYVLACKQKFAIPENVANYDVVGTWLPTWTWMSGNSISYSMESNWNNAFAINITSGLIIVSDYSKINGKIVNQDTTINLIIRTTDAVLGYELDTAQIWVKEDSYCVFFDFAGIGSGTKLDPYNDMDDVNFTAAGSIGKGFFLKRGSKISGESTTVRLIGSSVHPTIIGAYGTGANPVFNGSGAGATSECFYFGDEASTTTNRSEYVYMYDIDVRNYTWTGIEAHQKTKNMGFYNMYMHNNDKNGRQSNFVVYTDTYADSAVSRPYEFINCQFDTVGISGQDNGFLYEPSHLKLAASPSIISNCRFGSSLNACVRLAGGSLGVQVNYSSFNSGLVTTSESNYLVQVRNHLTTFTDCRFTNGSSGVYMTSAAGNLFEQPDNVTIRNCYFYGQGYAGIWMRPPGDTYNNSLGHLYENNLIISKGIGIKTRDCSGLIIRRNTIRATGGSSTYGITNEEADVNTSIQYNVIYGFATNQIYLLTGSGATIYNNTVDGGINCTGAGTETARNNFATAFTSIGTASNNIDMDTVLTSNFFVDYTGHNYHLKSTADTAINKGYNVGIGFDHDGNISPQGIAYDIGALEYVYSPSPPSTDYTLVDSIGVNLTWGSLLKYKWNNLASATAGSSVALNYYGGSSTGATMTNTSGWEGYGDQGYTAGYFPDTVQKSNFYSTATTYRNFVFSGLDNTHVYTFYVMGSRKSVGESPSRQIIFRINNDSTIITTTDNASSLATFQYVYPTTGSITLKCRKYVGDYMYINGIMIREYIPPSTGTPKRILNRVILIRTL